MPSPNVGAPAKAKSSLQSLPRWDIPAQQPRADLPLTVGPPQRPLSARGPVSPPALTYGDQIVAGAILAGRYRVVELLGRGGMGAVYRVHHLNTGEALALKVLSSALASNSHAVERFQTEARAPVKIGTDHVVRIVDADVSAELGGVPFLVMELLIGQDLGTELKRRGAISAGEVVLYFRQIARALDKAHSLGIVHRDLKPANLYLTKRDDGTPLIKILDFGIAKLTDGISGEVTQDGTIFGTPWYMAPEQARGLASRVGPGADLWALGLIAFRLLTGRNYWTAEGMAGLIGQIVYDPMLAPSHLAPHLGARFDTWFARACNRDIAQRFRSAAEQVQSLAEVLGILTDPGNAVAPSFSLEGDFVAAPHGGVPVPSPATPHFGPIGSHSAAYSMRASQSGGALSMSGSQPIGAGMSHPLGTSGSQPGASASVAFGLSGSQPGASASVAFGWSGSQAGGTGAPQAFGPPPSIVAFGPPPGTAAFGAQPGSVAFGPPPTVDLAPLPFGALPGSPAFDARSSSFPAGSSGARSTGPLGTARSVVATPLPAPFPYPVPCTSIASARPKRSTAAIAAVVVALGAISLGGVVAAWLVVEKRSPRSPPADPLLQQPIEATSPLATRANFQKGLEDVPVSEVFPTVASADPASTAVAAPSASAVSPLPLATAPAFSGPVVPAKVAAPAPVSRAAPSLLGASKPARAPAPVGKPNTTAPKPIKINF